MSLLSGRSSQPAYYIVDWWSYSQLDSIGMRSFGRNPKLDNNPKKQEKKKKQVKEQDPKENMYILETNRIRIIYILPETNICFSSSQNQWPLSFFSAPRNISLVKSDLFKNCSNTCWSWIDFGINKDAPGFKVWQEATAASLKATKVVLIRYRISSYSFRPWIVSSHSFTVTFGLMFCDLWISKVKKE